MTGAIGLACTTAFVVLRAPSLIEDLSEVAALSAGFMNPYSTGVPNIFAAVIVLSAKGRAARGRLQVVLF